MNCKHCGVEVVQAQTGRPKEFCSHAHRMAFKRKEIADSVKTAPVEEKPPQTIPVRVPPPRPPKKTGKEAPSQEEEGRIISRYWDSDLGEEVIVREPVVKNLQIGLTVEQSAKALAKREAREKREQERAKDLKERLAEMVAKRSKEGRPPNKFPNPEAPSVDLSIYLPTFNDANILAMIGGKDVREPNLPFPAGGNKSIPAGYKHRGAVPCDHEYSEDPSF